MLHDYKGLKVRQKSYELCFKTYKTTAKLPKEARYGLTAQIRRAVVSIPFNIVEGGGTLKKYVPARGPARLMVISAESV